MRFETVGIPLRFMTFMGHFIATVCVCFGVERQVKQSGQLGSNYSQEALLAATTELWAWLVISIILFAFQFLTLFGGFSAFMPKITVGHVLLHGWGLCFVALFIAERWHTGFYVPLFWIFSFIPAVLEGIVLALIFVLKTMQY